MLNSSPEQIRHEIDQAIRCIRKVTDAEPHVGIILGSGLGGIADLINDAICIDFANIPGFAKSTASGHRGQLIFGQLQGRNVIAMAGRFHRYEGHNRAAVTFPVCVMNALGANVLVVSNAAGGLNPNYSVGDLVVINSHIDWLGGGAMSITNDPFAGPPCRSEQLYDAELARLAVQTGLREGFIVHRGTYLGTLGPNYETRAEYRMMRRIGADLAGMSTIPEAIQGAALKMRVLALSMVSNVANPDAPEIASHEEVLQAGIAAAVKMESIVRQVISPAD